MRTRHVTSTRRVRASDVEVWGLLDDLDTWSRWAPVRGAQLERPGDGAPQGVGAVRALRTVTGLTRERITGSQAPHRQDYELLSGLPVQDYRSTVTIEPEPGGHCRVTWTSTYRAGWRHHLLLRLAVPAFARGLAREASRRAGDVPVPT